MSTKQINVFISHAWAHSEHYDTLAKWIFAEKWRVGQATLNFRDFSVPKSDPIHNASNDKQLKEAIYNQISRSHVVVIPMGMYVNYSKWIKKEIDGSINFKKPILAVDPWGQQRASSIAGNAANIKVGWNKTPVINGIWKLFK